jgi:hypothetical protein
MVCACLPRLCSRLREDCGYRPSQAKKFVRPPSQQKKAGDGGVGLSFQLWQDVKQEDHNVDWLGQTDHFSHKK